MVTSFIYRAGSSQRPTTLWPLAPLILLGRQCGAGVELGPSAPCNSLYSPACSPQAEAWDGSSSSLAGGCQPCWSYLAERGESPNPSPPQLPWVEAATASGRAIWPFCLLPASLLCLSTASLVQPWDLLASKHTSANVHSCHMLGRCKLPISPQAPQDEQHPQ